MKIIKLFTVCIISATLLLAGCSNLNNTNLSLEKNSFTVSGNLVLGSESGASPASRTATASYSDDITWKITASKGSSTYSPKDYVSGSSFTFDFEEPGEYTVKAEAVSEGSVFASGSEKITVKESGNKSVTIKALPVVSTALGIINLEINFDSSAASSVSSVYVEWQEPEFDRTAKALGFPMEAETADGAKTPELTPEVQAAMDAFYAWAARCYEGEFNKAFSVTDGKATISYDDIFCGAHSVKLCFNDASGDTLYSCTEILNVYSGFTTDSWYGTSPCLKAKQDGSVEFVISENFLSKHFAVSTPIMLYTNNGNNHKVSLFDSKTTNIINNVSYEGDYYLSYCVDDSGYVYILYYTGAVGSNDSPVHIYSNNPVFNNETVTPVDSDGGSLSLQYISYDLFVSSFEV